MGPLTHPQTHTLFLPPVKQESPRDLQGPCKSYGPFTLFHFLPNQHHKMILFHPPSTPPTGAGSEALALSQLYAKQLCEARGQEQNCLSFGNWIKQVTLEC